MNFLILALIMFLFMSAFFLIAVLKKNNGIVDIAWGLGFILVALYTYYTGVRLPMQQLVTALVVLWGLRLALYILIRGWGKPEDSRYAALREKWNKNFSLQSFVKIFLLQGILILIIAAPVISVNMTPTPFSVLTPVFLLTWILGFLFETVSDYQLYAFKREKRKGLLTTGLRKYSRYPSYFGEIVMWVSLYLISQQWLFFFGPLVLVILIFKVSGIPLLEEKRMKNPDYRKYAARTNKFFPWFQSSR